MKRLITLITLISLSLVVYLNAFGFTDADLLTAQQRSDKLPNLKE